MNVSITALHMDAWKIIRKYDMQQVNFALQVGIQTYDDQPSGPLKSIEPVISIEYRHIEHELQVLASSADANPLIALAKFEASVQLAKQTIVHFTIK
jgi:hypothetical protein